MLLRNVASQKIAVVALDVNNIPVDDAAANVTAKISKDGGGMVATNDVNPAELSAADAPGVYLFDMTQAETDAALVTLQAVTSSSGIHFEPVIVYPDNQALAAGAIKSTTFANNAITTAAIAANAITSSEIADNAITAAKLAANCIGAGQIAADAIGSSELAATAVAEIADGVWDEAHGGHVASGSTGESLNAAADKTGHKLASDGVDLVVIETGINLRQAHALELAALTGKISGAPGTTVTIKGADNSTTRILATVDADGNRSSMTLTPPA